MSEQEQRALALADAILKAAGSGLRHYTLQKSRDNILAAALPIVAQADQWRQHRDLLLSACDDLLVYLNDPLHADRMSGVRAAIALCRESQ